MICSANIDGTYGPGIAYQSRNKPWQPPAGLEYESYMGSRLILPVFILTFLGHGMRKNGNKILGR